MPSGRSPRPRRRSRPGAGPGRSSATRCCGRPPTRSPRARRRSARLLSREEGKTLAEGIGETVRAAQIFDFFAGECLRLTGEILPSVRPGVGVEITREAVGPVGLITPWNFPIAIPAWKIAPALAWGNTVVIKPADLVPGCTWAIVDILQPRRAAEGRAEPRDGQGLGGRPGDPRQPGHPRGQLHRLGRHRPPGRRGLDQGDAQVPARDGRQEPDGGARRRRPRGRGRGLPERRLLLDRPALHRLVAADRAGRHPRPLRRAALRADGGAEGRRPARQGDADRPGGRCGPARAGRELHRDRQGRGRRARRRRAAEARHRGLLPRAGALRRRDQRHADQPRGDLRPGRRGDPGEGLRRGARRGERHRVRAVGRHLHHLAQVRDPLQAQQPGRDGDGQRRRRRASTSTCRSAAPRARASARASRAATPRSSTPRSRPPTPPPERRS